MIVDFTRRLEPEPAVEAGWPAVAEHVAGQQLPGALGPHKVRDQPDDRSAISSALVLLVDDQLPQEPRPDYLRRIRLRVPADHDESDQVGRLAPGIDRAVPRLALREFLRLLQRLLDRAHEL